MKKSTSFSRKFFLISNYVFLGLASVICLLPLINVLAISLSSSAAAAANKVKLLPIDFNFVSYGYVLTKNEFIRSFLISLKRVFIGVPINTLLTILIAYPLSKDKSKFHLKGFFSWYFLLTILFSGGLIPWYMIIKYTGMIDKIWALVLPSAVPVFNVIVLLNFFRAIPKEMEESAFLDGASHWTTLFRIYLPVSLPSLATITLFVTVFHWNSWFDGLILMNRPENYPLQSYLQTIVVSLDANLFSRTTLEEFKKLNRINNRTVKAAQIFIAAIPVLAVYPLLQRYFMTGLVIGSVKG